MTREEIIAAIESATRKGSYYTERDFDALPNTLRYGVETFWEPGYDYQDPDFWEGYEDLSEDFVEAVIRYDLMRKEEEEA